MASLTDSNPLETPGVVHLPSFLERLSLRLAQWPWWAIVLVGGLVLAFYGILTTPIYDEALTYVTDNPALTTTDFMRVTYRVIQDGKTQVISGVLTKQDGDMLTVRTSEAQTTTVPISRVDSRQTNGDQITLHLPAQTISGLFYTESATDYHIQQPDGTIIAINKLSVQGTQHYTPANCTADTHGSCQLQVTIPESTVSGTLLGQTATDYTVQTVAPQFTTIPRSAISLVIAENSGQCALNNLGSCQTGIFLTLALTITSYSLALVIGLVIALMRISSQVVLRNFAILYIEVVRGIPILVILLMFYFAIGPLILDSQGHPMPAVIRAILGLAFAYGAFLAEIFRAGIQSINRGQMEAARSLGMSYFQAMRNVILPQAIRVVLPPLGNDFIAMLKDTSLVTAISLLELTYLAVQFSSAKLQPFAAFLTIAAVYLVMTLILSLFVRTIEHRVKLPS
ncbi:MAG: amino acid ABC transporter permease [Aggregatilineales bacterium]